MIYCLAHFRLRSATAVYITDRLSVLGSDYHAVHIRNTDYRTDYLPLLKTLFPSVARCRLLICSDDAVCRETAKRFFVEPEMLTVSDIPDTKGETLHFFAGDYRKNNLEMLVDLFAPAKANVLHVTPATHGTLSGFSLLTQLLNDNPRILHGLFASPAEARAE